MVFCYLPSTNEVTLVLDSSQQIPPHSHSPSWQACFIGPSIVICSWDSYHRRMHVVYLTKSFLALFGWRLINFLLHQSRTLRNSVWRYVVEVCASQKPSCQSISLPLSWWPLEFTLSPYYCAPHGVASCLKLVSEDSVASQRTYMPHMTSHFSVHVCYGSRCHRQTLSESFRCTRAGASLPEFDTHRYPLTC